MGYPEKVKAPALFELGLCYHLAPPGRFEDLTWGLERFATFGAEGTHKRRLPSKGTL
jgi:hypothetical protein